MQCTTLHSGLEDWQIVQQENGYGSLTLAGEYHIHRLYADKKLTRETVVVRVLREEDNTPVLPWTEVENCTAADETLRHGNWSTTLRLPAGGLYRVETALKSEGECPEVTRLFGGAIRFHIGVGDLFVIAGQSNAAGYGMDGAPDAPDLAVHLFRNCNRWALAAHPLNESTDADDALNAEVGCSGVSPCLAFAKAVRKAAGYPIGLIQTSMGGQPLSRWDSQENGDLLENMLAKIRLCGNKVAGILWYQGCSDTTPPQAEKYDQVFLRFVAEVRAALGAEVPFFTVQLNRYLSMDGDDRCWGILREKQRRISHAVPKVYLVPALDLPMSDNIHNSASGNVTLGRRIANCCAAALYGAPATLAPEISRAEAAGNTITLYFEHLQRGFMQYSENPVLCGFTVEDQAGKPLEITQFAHGVSAPNTLTLTLREPVQPGSTVSFGWQCNPTPFPPKDEVTYLPPLSFYRFPVEG